MSKSLRDTVGSARVEIMAGGGDSRGEKVNIETGQWVEGRSAVTAVLLVVVRVRMRLV